MAELPSGTVTFLFTDLEGSTASVGGISGRDAGSVGASRRAVARRDRVARRLRGQDDRGRCRTRCSRTRRTRSDATIGAQRALAGESWADTGALRVRMGIHSGQAELREGDYYGPR